MNKYAILDLQGGWLVNTVVWDGDTEKWNPPFGTIAKIFDEVDIALLPVNPNSIVNDND